MTRDTYDKEITALLVIDPYNDFISEGGKLWDRIRAVAEANDCVSHMLQVLNAARKTKLRVFYALHHRYRPGDYETWKYIAPIQKGDWVRKTFEYGELPGPRFDTNNTHGAGDSVGAAIASGLARRMSMPDAVALGKRYIVAAVAHSYSLGAGHGPVSPLWTVRPWWDDPTGPLTDRSST